VKKLAALFAITLPLLCAASQQPAYQQDSTIPKVWIVRKIAFESSMSGFMGDRINKGPMTIFPNPGDISVILAPDWKPMLLAQGQAPAWSPDGKQLAFCTVELSKSSFGQIQIINADGSGQTQLTKVNDGACLPDWSPDGEKIAFTACDGKAPRIATIDRNGQNYRVITNGFGPRWSTGGKKLLFYRDLNRDGTRRAIWVMNADGTGARKVIEENEVATGWGEGGQARFFDEESIIFSAAHEHVWSIFRVKLDGTNLETFAGNVEFDLLDPSISPDGTQLVVQGLTKQTKNGGRTGGEIVMLSLDLRNNLWTRLQYGVYPSVVWEKSDATVAALAPLTDKSLIAQGKARYLFYKCDECHGATGKEGGDGPELAGTLMSAEEISKFLVKPSPDAYMKGMPDIPLTNPDHQALIAYILSLKRPQNPN
jgi:Tol biopolymer transport system component